MRQWILATAMLVMSPAAAMAHGGFHFSIGLGGIRFGVDNGHGRGYGVVCRPPVWVHRSYYGPTTVYVPPPVYITPSVVYAAPPVYITPPTFYAEPRVYVPAPRVYVPAPYVAVPYAPAPYVERPSGYYYCR